MVGRVSCDGDGVAGVPGVVGVVGIQKKGDPTGSTMMVMMGIIPETTSVCLLVESRVSNPKTTFVGVESKGTRADVSASDWSANDWSASEGTKILYADQSGADTSAFVSSYHVPLEH
ncbi:hypothetical protein Tco_1522298, partial [Tanacetum coccineum]